MGRKEGRKAFNFILDVKLKLLLIIYFIKNYSLVPVSPNIGISDCARML